MNMNMNSIPCQLQNHENHKIITLCLHKNCFSKRLCCLQCLIDFHSDHMNNLVEIDSLNKFIQEQSNKQVEYPQSYTYGQCQLIHSLELLLNLVDSFQQIIKNEIEKLRKLSLQQYLKQQSNNQNDIKNWNQLIQDILKFVDNDQGHIKWNDCKQVPLNIKEQKQIKILNNAKEALTSIGKQIMISFKKKQFNTNSIKLEVVTQGSIKDVAISQDGAIIATGSDDKTVKLWNLSTKKIMQTLQYTGAVYGVAISSSKQYVAYGGGGDFSIKLYNLWYNSNYGILIGHKQYVQTIVFSQDSQLIYSGGSDNKLIIWNLSQKQQIQIFCTDSIVATIVSSSDNKLISCICMNSINIWNLQTKTQLINYQNPHSRIGYGLCSNYDSSIFISSGSDGLIKIWSLNDVGNNKYTLTVMRQIKAANKVIFKVILSSDEQNIISICNQDAKIMIYQIESENQVQELKYGIKKGEYPNGYISLSDDMEILVSGGEDKNIEIWTRE